MPCDGAVVTINQDRVCPSEFFDAGRYLGDLFIRMRATVVDVRYQSVNGSLFDLYTGFYRREKSSSWAKKKPAQV